ncbi:Zinc finger CCHC-type [Trinorchestia longiramus]|nr:Zinc finger CCHC-type [Trinorchestia longiramus]
MVHPRVTIVRDKTTRRSQGTAFLLFFTRAEALACVAGTHNCCVMGRTLTAAMARDNGRAAEFIKRKEYPDKSRCYECGEFGHLSYSCPKNSLGPREPPKKKRKLKKDKSKSTKTQTSEKLDEDGEDDEEDFDDESLSSAIRFSQQLREAEEFTRTKERTGSSSDGVGSVTRAPSYKPSSYFSDEEELE